MDSQKYRYLLFYIWFVFVMMTIQWIFLTYKVDRNYEYMQQHIPKVEEAWTEQK